MKQITFITLLLILLSFGLSAQTNPINEMNGKKALDIEITDIAGNNYVGKLWYIDSTQIVISDELFGEENLKLFTPDQIYSLKIKKNGTFIKSFLITSGFIASVATIAMVSTCEDCMVGVGFIFAVAYIKYAILPGLAGGIIFKTLPVKNIEYITNSSDSAYHISVETMKKEVKIPRDYSKAEKNIILKDQNKLDGISVPKKRLHPFNYPKFNFELTVDFNFTNPITDVNNTFNSAYNISSTSSRNETPRYSATFSYNILKHLQVYAGYSHGGNYIAYGINSAIIDTITLYDEIILTQSFQSASIGFNYVINPVNNLLLKRFQFELGLGYTMTKMDYSSRIYTGSGNYDNTFFNNEAILETIIDKTYNSNGLKINSNVKYFVHNNLSLNAGFYYDLMKNIQIDAVSVEASSGRKLELNAYNMDFSSMYIKLGVELHF